MGNYTELLYHFVWATKKRAPFITSEVEPLLHDYIRHQCRALRVTVQAINGMSDHVHLACALPASLSVSEFAGKIKGASAWYINREADASKNLQMALNWQPNYGALTFGKHDLPRIVSYVDNQKLHHAKGQLLNRLELCDDGYTTSSAPKGLRSV